MGRYSVELAEVSRNAPTSRLSISGGLVCIWCKSLHEVQETKGKK